MSPWAWAPEVLPRGRWARIVFATLAALLALAALAAIAVALAR